MDTIPSYESSLPSTLSMLINASFERSDISYRDIAVAIGSPTLGHAMIRHVMKHMELINDWCKDRGVPYLTTLIVRSSGQRQGYPGEGYFAIMQDLGLYTPANDTWEARELWHDTYQQVVYDFWSLEKPMLAFIK